ncbi:high mobility group box domain-containing protein [Lanmaoa asiatica]|nr:high mobility group box domain-containing protein [Lanmaoa asiatica]
MLPFDFTAPPSFDSPLVPPPHQWPAFDEILMCAISPSDSSELSPSPSPESDSLPTPFPSSSALAAMPIPPSRSPPRNKNPDHIPRPRNAFMLFRSAFSAAQKISANIEHDNRHITRIIAHCWNRLSDAEKQVWRDKAAAEKAQHAERYPNYRFSPVGRANKPLKRKVRRNGVEDVKRCEKLAELVMAGKHGQELESAVKKFDDECHSAEHPFDIFTSPEKRRTPCVDRDPRDSEPSDVPPFRSPLLPPTKTASEQVPDECFMPEVSYQNHMILDTV